MRNLVLLLRQVQCFFQQQSEKYLSRAIEQYFQELEQHLAESAGPYLTGSDFGTGDAALSVVYLRLEEAGWLDLLCPFSDFPLIRKHYETLRARRSWEVLVGAYPASVAQAALAALAAAHLARGGRRERLRRLLRRRRPKSGGGPVAYTVFRSVAPRFC